ARLKIVRCRPKLVLAHERAIAKGDQRACYVQVIEVEGDECRAVGLGGLGAHIYAIEGDNPLRPLRIHHLRMFRFQFKARVLACERTHGQSMRRSLKTKQVVLGSWLVSGEVGSLDLDVPALGHLEQVAGEAPNTATVHPEVQELIAVLAVYKGGPISVY